MSTISIRALDMWDEMTPVEAIQRVVWGDDPTIIMYANILVSIARNGGSVLGAFDGDQMIGCAIGFLGTDTGDKDRPAMANLKLYSKRVGVLEAYRDKGVGYQLKLAQRDFARQRSIRLITWTYDPLLSRNAYFNIRKLGVVTARYYRDYYGTEAEALTLAGSSDRFQADWWITSRRVEQRLLGTRSALSLSHYLSAETNILNPTTAGPDSIPWPTDRPQEPQGLFALIEIPTDYRRIVSTDLPLALTWREHSRDMFALTLSKGYIVTDFLHESYGERQRSFYVLSYDGSDTPQPFSRN